MLVDDDVAVCVYCFSEGIGWVVCKDWHYVGFVCGLILIMFVDCDGLRLMLGLFVGRGLCLGIRH